MLISKFDLYKGEWLELVFDDRNKEYGAYELRQQYAGIMVKAMGITFLFIMLVSGVFYISKSGPIPAPVSHDHHTVVTLSQQPVLAIKKPQTPPAAKQPKAPAPAKPISTIRVVPPVVVPDAQAQKPIENDHITAQISTETKTVPGNSSTVDITETPATPGGDGPPAVDNSVHPTFGLDVMPEPAGGEAAWSKFLSRNLRFPGAAEEQGASGRVYLSFIIEKDGSLSNITVIKPAGYGFDEEAVRVLKLAKAWKPGVQNGQPVRVKYTIPINFQFTENN